MVDWSNDFGLVQSGNSDIDFISIRLAHESHCAAARRAERADAPGPLNLARFALGKLKIATSKRTPRRKWGAGTLATIFAMAMCDIVRLTDAFVSNSAAQTTAANGLWLRFHH
jgi:ferric-dicitrate binding protein FerR (iron transport regulator)